MFRIWWKKWRNCSTWRRKQRSQGTSPTSRIRKNFWKSKRKRKPNSKKRKNLWIAISITRRWNSACRFFGRHQTLFGFRFNNWTRKCFTQSQKFCWSDQKCNSDWLGSQGGAYRNKSRIDWIVRIKFGLIDWIKCCVNCTKYSILLI